MITSRNYLGWKLNVFCVHLLEGQLVFILKLRFHYLIPFCPKTSNTIPLRYKMRTTTTITLTTTTALITIPTIMETSTRAVTAVTTTTATTAVTATTTTTAVTATTTTTATALSQMKNLFFLIHSFRFFCRNRLQRQQQQRHQWQRQQRQQRFHVEAQSRVNSWTNRTRGKGKISWHQSRFQG